MARMRAVDAAVQVLECEGIDCAFGVPGAAINPFYSAMKARGPTRHILARHVEAASHMAEGYTPAKAGNISLCIGTSGPAGTDMITGLYSASADSILILCVTGQAPRAAAQGGLPGDRHRGHRGSGRQVGEDRHGAPLGVRAADPDRRIVALSGDYDFQFLNEELAVGAQHRLPCIHVVVNNAYLGLIRQAQRGFGMDFEVSLAFENVNTIGHAEIGYGVDHVKVAEAMGCKAVRVRRPEEFAAGFAEAERLMAEHKVPVLLEFILERVTNIAMGTEIDDIVDF